MNWDKNTFLRLISAPPERLTSRFQVTHGMLLNVLSRKGDGCAAMRKLIRDSPRKPQGKEGAHPARLGNYSARCSTGRSWSSFRKTEAGNYLRVNVELQEDFSMDQALSLYLLDTIPLMDPQAPDYALVLLTLVESILEDPDIILRKQLDKVKDRKMAEMKMEGIEYEQRMDELEKLEYPKPNREFVYSTFNAFAARHPWVGEENIRPKSIAREMFEEFRSFADYIKLYELHRAEGVLLRHLNSVFKVLAQTVPDAAKNDQVREMELYLGTMIRQVDSSLLDEWEKMRDPGYRPTETKEVRPPGAEEAAADITRDTKAFTAVIRNRIFTFLRGLIVEDYDTALANLSSAQVSGQPAPGTPADPADTIRGVAVDADGQPWTAARLKELLDSYHVDHEYLSLDPNARNLRHTYVLPSEDKKSWRVQQMLVDPEEHNDWVAEFEVDLAESRIAGEPVLRLRRVGSLT